MMDQFLFAFFLSISVGGFSYVFVYPYLSGEKKAAQRQAALLEGSMRANSARSEAANRRKQIAETLRDMEGAGRSKKVTLETRVTQAGLEITKQTFLLVSLGTALFVAIALLIASGSIVYALLGLVIGGVVLPHLTLVFLKNRRTKKFLDEFPEAVDVIIRGIKSGLPLGACLQTVASQSSDPVKTEFRMIVEATLVGLTVPEAIERMVERMPIPETNFFSIVVSIQQKSGGNLTEALGNLSRVLRDRKKMHLRVKALTSEGKTSAIIVGALPFIVSGGIFLINPRAFDPLFYTEKGQMILAGALIWAFIGIVMMKLMVSVKV
jgi:tight adherence protein B